MTAKAIFTKVFYYLLRGMLLTLPLALTVYLIYFFFTTIDGLLGFDQAGIGFLVTIVFLTFIGFLGTSFIARPLINWFNSLLKKLPLIKTIYDAIKDLLSAFVGQKKSFSKAVMVDLAGNGNMKRLGFVTEEDLSTYGIDSEYIAVYFPHSYNFSGNLFIVPKNNVTFIDAKPADLMKFIVSAGISKSE